MVRPAPNSRVGFPSALARYGDVTTSARGGGVHPPAGYIFLIDADGAILTDADGAYLVEFI